MNRQRLLPWATVIAASALLLAGCAGSSAPESAATTSAPASPVDEDAAALVPDEIRERGVLNVVSPAELAPATFIEEGGTTPVGYSIDIIKAIADTLDLDIEITNAAFDTVIPGIQGGKFDVGVSAFAVSKARLEIIDMVSYAQSGGILLVRADEKDPPVVPADLCGYTTAALQGSTELEIATQASEDCVADGDEPVDIKVFPNSNAGVLALSSGQVDVMIFTSLGAGYISDQSDGAVVGSGEGYESELNAVAVAKEPGLAPAIEAALHALVESGRYDEILEEWNSTIVGIPASEMVVNPEPAF